MRFLQVQDFIKFSQNLYTTENVCLLFPTSFDWIIFRSNKSFERDLREMPTNVGLHDKCRFLCRILTQIRALSDILVKSSSIRFPDN
jgi:hypothetical protein